MLNESLNLNQISNQNNIQNKLEIIWIDKKIRNEENQSYIKDLKSNTTAQSNNAVNSNPQPTNVYEYRENLSSSKFNIHEYDDLDKAIEQIKKFRFIETIIIVGGHYLPDFIKKFKENIKNIFIIPRIIVFTSINHPFENEILQDKFYSGIIIYTYAKLKSVINSHQLNNEQLITKSMKLTNNQYNSDKPIFVPIKTRNDLKLPEYYKDLVTGFTMENNPNFISTMFNIYKNDPKYNGLLNQMINFPTIPIELLTKYYARLYSIDGDFYKKMNEYLLSINYESYNINNTNFINIYEPYIKTMYEGINQNIFKTCLSNELYGTLQFSENEIKEFFSYKENFLKESTELQKELLLPVIFSKSFISFHKDINEAEKYIRYGRNAMLVLKTTNKEFDLKTHADIEEFSFYPNEKEVLFFPFSAFGIAEFKFNPLKNLYNIDLIYYGKFKSITRDGGKNCCCFII